MNAHLLYNFYNENKSPSPTIYCINLHKQLLQISLLRSEIIKMAASKLQQWLIKYILASTNQDSIASTFMDSDELESLLATLDQDARCDLISIVRSQEDKTALDYAVEYGHQDIV